MITPSHGHTVRDITLRLLVLTGVFAASIAFLGCTVGPAKLLARSSGNAYCDSPVVRDYERPLRHFPAVRRPPNTGRLPFGPRTFRFRQVFELPRTRLITGKGGFGYSFWNTNFESVLHLGWTVKAELYAISERGFQKQRLRARSKRLGAIGTSQKPQITFQVPGDQDFARFDMSFRDRDGRYLGKFSEYIRILEEFLNVRVGTEKKLYRPGNLLHSRVENLGTEAVSFGASFKIERLTDTGEWVRVGPSIGLRRRHPPTKYVASVSAGGSSRCMSFVIPTTFEPGQYRVAKRMEYGPTDDKMTEIIRFGRFEVID